MGLWGSCPIRGEGILPLRQSMGSETVLSSPVGRWEAVTIKEGCRSSLWEAAHPGGAGVLGGVIGFDHIKSTTVMR